MIAFWNRKEVYMGYSMATCGEIRSILAENHIQYTYKVVNTCASNRRVRGNFGEKVEWRYMYYVYVDKKDYEWACRLIKDNG